MAFGVYDKDQPWVNSKTTPQPTFVSLQPITLTGARDKVGKKAYIRATSFPDLTLDSYLARAKYDSSWRTYEVPGSHFPMFDMPERLVEILLEVD